MAIVLWKSQVKIKTKRIRAGGPKQLHLLIDCLNYGAKKVQQSWLIEGRRRGCVGAIKG